MEPYEIFLRDGLAFWNRSTVFISVYRKLTLRSPKKETRKKPGDIFIHGEHCDLRGVAGDAQLGFQFSAMRVVTAA